MKDKIQSFGDKFISIIAILSYLAVIVSGFGAMQGYGGSFWIGLVTIIGGAVSVTMLFYGIFIMIDIRDSLREIKNKN